MRRLAQIKERLYAPSLAYDMGFSAGAEAEAEMHKHAAADMHWLLQEVERLEKENESYRKADHDKI